jgi:hypothetical protein
VRLLQASKRATEVFGIPGDFALPLFREFERSALLPLVTLSHEPAVGFAADAAARARGGLGVATVTYGAGAFNLVNAVAGAYAERVPLVVLSVRPQHTGGERLPAASQVKTLDCNGGCSAKSRSIAHASTRAGTGRSRACSTRRCTSRARSHRFRATCRAGLRRGGGAGGPAARPLAFAACADDCWRACRRRSGRC